MIDADVLKKLGWGDELIEEARRLSEGLPREVDAAFADVSRLDSLDVLATTAVDSPDLSSWGPVGVSELYVK